MDDTNLEEDLLRMQSAHRDAICAAVVVSAGSPLPPSARMALLAMVDRIGLAGPQVDDFRLQIAADTLRVEDIPAEPILLGSEARDLSARTLLLGLRLGGRAETTAAAVAAHLRTSPERLARLVAAIRPAAGGHPLPTTELSASLKEFTRPPGFLRDLLGGGGPPRRRVGHVAPSRYRHDLDIQATRAVSSTIAFEDAARKLSELLPERAWRALNAAGRVQVGPDQFPELYEVYRGCCKRLAIHPEPPLFIARGGFNAMTMGIEEPVVIIHDLLVGLLPQRELEFVIGHELGHIKFDHVLNLTIAQLLKVPGMVLDRVPILGPFLKTGLDLALFEWQRKAELSCDRAGLLCAQDPDAGYRVMMRMAGAPALYAAEFNIDAFIRQYEDLQVHQKDLLTRSFYMFSTATRSHPWAAVRAYELKQWIESGEYQAVLDESPAEDAPWLTTSAPDPPTLPMAHRCSHCGIRVPATIRQCVACNTPVQAQNALRPCAACDAELEPGHQFCETCGTPASSTVPPMESM
ncbi:MAG: hypothetical protein CL927_15060 [Deltaproteobacteria bacterium]|nr:hypothetical protein [Deltaproteobacteria bacterium]